MFPLTAISSLFLLIWGLYKLLAPLVRPPAHFPKNIPTIPFYYTLIPIFKEVDQEELYRKYLQKPLTDYGAVRIFFGGNWNVLITRPAYVAQVLKHDEVFPKAGNQVKLPHSVLAHYTGENIISAVGDTHKLFASVMKPGLQVDVDASIIVRNAEKLISLLLRDQGEKGRVDMYLPTQAYAIQNMSESLMGSDFETLGNPNARIAKLQSEIKPKIFNPIYLNFPILDHFSIPSRMEARRLAKTFKDELAGLVLQGHRHKHGGESGGGLGCRLVAAFEKGQLSEYHFQQNCVAAFLAGHENPQILLLSSLFILAENQDIQDQVRKEVLTLPPDDRVKADALANLPLLTSVIYETLRLFPPISQLMNKRTASDVYLGDSDILLPKDTYVGYNGYSTNRDRDFWGADAHEFRPSRWGANLQDMQGLFRRATSKGTFISFHGGKRACLGQKWALATHRLTMAMFLTSVRWRLHPTWPRKMTPAGPLMPKKLALQIENIEKA